MFLKSIEVKNYKSLEDVCIKNLEAFNVFIGRNNAGKSSILAVLELFAKSLEKDKGATDVSEALTDFEINRCLELQLSFDLGQKDREQLIELVPTTNQNIKKSQLIDTSLFRKAKYTIKTKDAEGFFISSIETFGANNDWLLIFDMGISNKDSRQYINFSCDVSETLEAENPRVVLLSDKASKSMNLVPLIFNKGNKRKDELLYLTITPVIDCLLLACCVYFKKSFFLVPLGTAMKLLSWVGGLKFYRKMVRT